MERTRAFCWFEDDDLIGSGLEVALRHVSFAVEWAKEGQHAKLALSTTRYDMAVLDIELLGLSVPPVTRVIFAQWSQPRRRAASVESS
ncbi:response regulator, partial [Caballeronia grimmiae]